jgi:general secretion pathway protein G
MSTISRKVKRGFTLIEILIVVVILGILAAIVIPQFTDASQEAMESSVRSQLQTIRSQIELYRVKEAGSLPDLTPAFDDLVADDYLQAPASNPLVAASVATVVGTAAGSDCGWFYNDTTGDISAVDAAGAALAW